ncbi:MAG: tRNA epoxyqueuosine(34) reductase QueG, partial [Gammaproteobacteria bacterium]
MTGETIRRLAAECGFELCGVTPATPVAQMRQYRDWVAAGMAGEMRYLSDRRAAVRDDPRNLLATARSVICVGKVYQTARPLSTEMRDSERGWISRYAWGSDYHDVLGAGLRKLAGRIAQERGEPFESKICVDTAPLLERAYAQRAGLGWIAKNTCLINERMGSWFFLGELLVSFDVKPDAPPEERCGTCTRCIDACPTGAIVPLGPAWAIDSRRCISYFTIELRGAVPEPHREGMGNHVFGCDVCQDVCPWNGRSPLGVEPAFEAQNYAPPLEELAEADFAARFASSPVKRARANGLLRNVAIAMGNSRSEKFRRPLETMAASGDGLVAEHARWALGKLAALVMALFSFPAAAQDPLASKGFDHFYNLEYDQAIAEFERGIEKDPSAVGLRNHLAQAIQFRELYRVGALESELVSGNNSFLRRPKVETTAETEKKFLDTVQKAIELAQARLAKNPNDTGALYGQGVAYGLRG